MGQASGRLKTTLLDAGAKDEMTCVAILGAICYPVVTRVVKQGDAAMLAARVLPVLRPLRRTSTVASRTR